MRTYGTERFPAEHQLQNISRIENECHALVEHVVPPGQFPFDLHMLKFLTSDGRPDCFHKFMAQLGSFVESEILGLCRLLHFTQCCQG